MTTLLYTIATLYLVISAVTFLAYSREPFWSRIGVSIVAPIVVASLVWEWVVTRFEELG
jgi:hypothetical protein